MIKILRTSLLGLLALPLAAQAPGFSVAGGALLGFASLEKATNNTVGYQVGFDWTGQVPAATIPTRVGLAFTSFPGKDWNGLKTSLTLVQLHGDLLLPIRSLHGYGIVGASLNSYSMSESGTEDTEDPTDINQHFPIRDAKGVKMGLRLGLGFTLASHLALEATFQQTELAGKDLSGDTVAPDGTELVRQGAINPAWLQLGVTYRF